MYGAIIGDIVGSKYEFHNIKTKDFPLFSPGCDYTDDSIMTLAVGKALMLCPDAPHGKDWEARLSQAMVDSMQDFGRRYPYPTGAYGGRFAQWLRQTNPQPYNSFGNGSAMRVSSCGLAAKTLADALALARVSAAVSHNHPEGIKGAQAVAAAVFLARSGMKKDAIRTYLQDNFYLLDFTLDEIRDSYSFNESCQGSVPQALEAFLESVSFEDAIRNVISLGGDCDTTGAITGAVAWAYYAAQKGGPDREMQSIRLHAETFLPTEFRQLAADFDRFCQQRTSC